MNLTEASKKASAIWRAMTREERGSLRFYDVVSLVMGGTLGEEEKVREKALKWLIRITDEQRNELFVRYAGASYGQMFQRERARLGSLINYRFAEKRNEH